jgi:phosphomannomutase
MVVKKDYTAVFKAYDLRGVYPSEIDNDFAYMLGKAFVAYTKAKEIAVGFDGRKSSPKLFEFLKKGLIEAGAVVTELGLVSTPMSYFAVIQGKFDAGIMITASHNPKDWNGFKLMLKKAEPLFIDNGSLEILKIIQNNSYIKAKKGKAKKKSYAKEYESFLKGLSKKASKNDLKLVIDQSNGSGVHEVNALKSLFPSAKVINGKVSGNPAHEPNPLSADARKQLVNEIKKQKADLGVIFDGDADRVAFITSKGQFVRPDIILSLLIKELKKGPIIYDTRSSQAVVDTCEKKGLQAIMSKSGRTFIFKAMKDEKAELGAENSGHFFFKETDYLDNAGVCAVKVLNLLKNSDVPLSEIMKEFDGYHHSGEINFKVKNTSKAFLLVEQAFTEPVKTLFIDGLSVYYDDFWFNLRKSNTESIVRLNAEAKSKEVLDKHLKRINNIMFLVK